VYRSQLAHLLVVDADPHFADNLGIALQKAGFVVHMAGNVKEALQTSQKLSIDVALVDAKLFAAAGRVLCAGLRKRRRVPIIVLAASKRADDMVIALLAGADDYIAKPFSLRDVTARIEKLVQRPAAQ
jgi:DNA-binding response OmpR family regulator